MLFGTTPYAPIRRGGGCGYTIPPKQFSPKRSYICYTCYMAINLRHISEELHQKLNVRAATEKVTLESLCIRFLWQGLDYEGGVDDMSFSKKTDAVVLLPDRPSPVEISRDKQKRRDEKKATSRPAHAMGCTCMMCKEKR